MNPDGGAGAARSGNGPARPRVAIVPWGNCLEDFLDPIGLSVDAFLEDMDGGWLFGYVGALASCGVDGVLYCVSRSVSSAVVRRHRPTGCGVRLLPVPRIYDRIRGRLVDPYTRDPVAAVGRPLRRGGRLLATLALEAAPYLAIDGRAFAAGLAEDGCTAILVQEYEDPRFDRLVSLGRRLAVPVFATFQGGDQPIRRLERFTRRRSIARAAGLIVASRREAERVRAEYGPAPPILDAPNPLDPELWYPEPKAEARAALGWDAAERVAIFHGRIDIRRKGLDVLVRAWETVEASVRRPVRLLIVGDGQDAAAFRDLLAASSARHVDWSAAYSLDRAVMRRTLSAADVAVTASRLEGFPVAPVEAMACGLALVASDAPGLPEILGNETGEVGRLVSREDAPGLAAALLELLEDDGKAAALGQRARASVVARFGYEAIGRRLADFLFPPSP